MVVMKNIRRMKKLAWETLSSPRTIAFIKVGAAVVSVVHAVNELLGSPRKTSTVGFKFENDDVE